MKRFKAVDFSLNPNVKKQIEREVNILKHIEHENLVKFFELLVVKSEEHFEQFFILTEYYEVSNFISLKVIRHMNKTHPKYYKMALIPKIFGLFLYYLRVRRELHKNLNNFK